MILNTCVLNKTLQHLLLASLEADKEATAQHEIRNQSIQHHCSHSQKFRFVFLVHKILSCSMRAILCSANHKCSESDLKMMVFAICISCVPLTFFWTTYAWLRSFFLSSGAKCVALRALTPGKGQCHPKSFQGPPQSYGSLSTRPLGSSRDDPQDWIDLGLSQSTEGQGALLPMQRS